MAYLFFGLTGLMRTFAFARPRSLLPLTIHYFFWLLSSYLNNLASGVTF